MWDAYLLKAAMYFFFLTFKKLGIPGNCFLFLSNYLWHKIQAFELTWQQHFFFLNVKLDLYNVMPMLKQHAIHGNSPCFLLREINLGDFFVKRPRQWFSNFAINKNTASKQKNNFSMVMAQPWRQLPGAEPGRMSWVPAWTAEWVPSHMTGPWIKSKKNQQWRHPK